MAMREFLWILNQSLNDSFGSAGVSTTYILTDKIGDIAPEEIAGSRVWIILRGLEDRVFQCVTVKKVERILDGFYKDKLLLTADLLKSFRLSRGYVDADNYVLDCLGKFPLGFLDSDKSVCISLRTLIKRNKVVRLTPPPKVNFDSLDVPLPKSPALLAEEAVRSIVANFTLNRLWSNASGQRLGPFSNFAAGLIGTKLVMAPVSSHIMDALSSLDPVEMLADRRLEGMSDSHVPRPLTVPKIDLGFTAIDPMSIHARSYVASDKIIDWDIILEKTEEAERTHQAMLKDISIFLLSCGIVPFESGSIDLMFQRGAETFIFEIKSSTPNNFLSQCSKGAFQLAWYSNAMLLEFPNLYPRLIIHTINNPTLETEAIAALLRLNIQALTYDPAVPWPSKVGGLLWN
jgi:hypothetical protein